MSRIETLDLKPWPEPAEAVKGLYPLPDGTSLPRVTSVERMIGLGTEALCAWHERNGIEAALAAVRKHADWFKDMPVDEFTAHIEPAIKAEKASIAKMNKAADIGTMAHKMAEHWIREQAGLPEKTPMPKGNEQATWAFMAFQDWFREAGLKVVRTEQFVYSKTVGAAGTIDYLVESDEGLGIIDLKSSNYILSQHHVQVATYLAMAREWRDIQWAKIVRIPKVYGEVAVEVRDLGNIFNMRTKEHEWKSPEELLQAFKGALAIYRVFMEP